MTITRLGIGLAFLAALTGLVLPVPVATSLLAAVLAASAGDALVARRPPGLDRTVPSVLSRGVPAEVDIRCDGQGLRVRLRQPGGADVRIDPPEGNQRIVASLTAARRGRHELAAPAGYVRGPFGLGAWHHRLGRPTSVVVYPDMPAAQRLALAVRTGRFREEGHRSRGPLGLGTDFESIREYLPDDDIRQLNVRATARMGTPMTNQYRVEQDRDVICLLDCGRLMRAPVHDRTRLDAAVDAVAAIAAVADEVGDRCGVVAFDRSLLRTVRPRRDGAEAVVRAVFDLEPSAVDSDYELAFRTAAAMKRSFILILTDLLDEMAGRTLADAVPILARKHAVTVASVVDDSLLALVHTPATTLAEATKTAVALDLIAGRNELVAQLRHRGAEVVEAPLEGFSARCVGAYLRAKSRGRL